MAAGRPGRTCQGFALDHPPDRAGPARISSARQAASCRGTLDARVDMFVRWHGGDLPRLLGARHARLHEGIAGRFFGDLPSWVVEPEVSFSIYGERGIIDILAWHPTRRILLVIELKTEIVDVERVAREAGPEATPRHQHRPQTGAGARSAVSTWVVIADSRSNRRAVVDHATVLRAKLPVDGPTMRAWLRSPVESDRRAQFHANRAWDAPWVDVGPDPRVVKRRPRTARTTTESRTDLRAETVWTCRRCIESPMATEAAWPGRAAARHWRSPAESSEPVGGPECAKRTSGPWPPSSSATEATVALADSADRGTQPLPARLRTSPATISRWIWFVPS